MNRVIKESVNAKRAEIRKEMTTSVILTIVLLAMSAGIAVFGMEIFSDDGTAIFVLFLLDFALLYNTIRLKVLDAKYENIQHKMFVETRRRAQRNRERLQSHAA